MLLIFITVPHLPIHPLNPPTIQTPLLIIPLILITLLLIPPLIPHPILLPTLLHLFHGESI